MRFFASKSGKYLDRSEEAMNIADKVKMEFENAIHDAIEEWQSVERPSPHFSRNRKLDQVTMIKLLYLMGGNSLRKELYD